MKEVGRMKTKELNKGEIIITSQDLHKPIYEFFKRILDVICSVVALIVLSPAFLVTALAVRSDGGPAFYKQTRVGKNNTHFEMYKFRSMCKNAENLQDDLMKYNEMDGPVFKIKGDPRITKVGKFIRKYSIDELPQLLNIVKGDMSIVGPRPPLVREVEQYNSYQMQRLLVTPGLTCFWQAYGRSDLSFDDWMDKYALLIDLGNSLKPLDEKYKTENNLIEGCQSRVWLQADYKDGKVFFQGESDAVIVKGLVSLLINVLSGHTPDEILNSELYFIEKIGLKEHLSPTRSNGLLSMVKQMHLYALAFKVKNEK